MNGVMDRSGLLTLALVCMLALACGRSDEAPATASGTAMIRVSDPSSANSSPLVTGVRFVPASAVPGESLEAVAEATDPDGDAITLRYEWEIGGRRILSDGAEIVVPDAERGSTIRVSVTASDGVYESTTAYLDTRVGNRAPRISHLEIETIHSADGVEIEPHWQVLPSVEDPDRDHTSVEFQWIVNGLVVDDSGSRFAKSRVRRGDEVRVRVVAFDGQTEGIPLESATMTIGNSAPKIVSSPPDLDPSGRFHYQPEVEDPDADGAFRFRLLAGPPGMALDESTGALTWQPTIEQAGTHPVELEVADADGASSRQSFDMTVQVDAATPGPASPR